MTHPPQPPRPPGVPPRQPSAAGPRPTSPPLQRRPPEPQRPTEEGVGAPLFGGAVAALLGAGLWTLIVKLTDREVGWVAWAVGGFVGLVMSRMTSARSGTLGVYAAVFAGLGLATGKVLTLTVAAPEIAHEIAGDPEAMTQAFVWDMREREAFAPEINVELARLKESNDTLPDELWQRMVGEASARMEAAPAAERQRVAQSAWRAMVAATSVTEQFVATLSLFDLLWFFLAIGTAWKMMQSG